MKQREINLSAIQWSTWILVFLLMLFYTIREKSMLERGLIGSIVNLGTCLLAIYGQSHFLMQHFFKKGKIVHYAIGLSLMLLFLVMLRAVLEYATINRIFGINHFYTLSPSHFAFSFLSMLLCLIIGFLLRISLDYVEVLKHNETLRQQQLISEINLLKAQVQPHFMFNTLNNIYSLAHQKSDKTAEVVAKLSDIMRYFVHEAAREKVPLSVEVNLIKGYIELERIRMKNSLNLDFTINIVNSQMLIPPMLFIPFVENYFKHGIDKTLRENNVKIELTQTSDKLLFRMKNKLLNGETSFNEGVGLNNIKKRLHILFDKSYILAIETRDGYFDVQLSIPIL